MDHADRRRRQGPDLRINSARTTGRRCLCRQGPDGAVQEGSNRIYWIELRDGSGFDANLGPQNRGFIVSIANDFSCIPTCAIDGHPETEPAGDSAFQPGDTFKDGTICFEFIDATHVRVRPDSGASAAIPPPRQ